MLQPFQTFRRTLFLSLAVAAALCCAAPHPCRADIVIGGSGSNGVAQVDAWCRIHIPGVFRTHTTVTVTALTAAQMSSYLATGDPNSDNSSNHNDDASNANDDIDGIFENDPPRITLRVPDAGQIDWFTFAHEYGHFVWFDIFSSSDRTRYGAVYNAQRASHHLVTRYAATNVEEGFAESFSFYINAAPILQHRDSASYAFLQDWAARTAAPPAHD
ncbi:MAG: hypothetical protein ACLQVD_02960 [Capsulimonadaceae bacterium]